MPDKFTAARDAMLEEIERVQRPSSVTQDELSKAVKQFVSATLSSRKTMQGQAQDLGANWLAANDLSFSERYLAAVKKVTARRTSACGGANICGGKPVALRSAAHRHRAENQRDSLKASQEHPIEKFRIGQRPAPAR